MKAAPKLYVHSMTGEIKRLRKHHAKNLSDAWTEIEFTKNQEGVPVMRLQLKGATVDISENTSRTDEIPEGEVVNG